MHACVRLFLLLIAARRCLSLMRVCVCVARCCSYADNATELYTHYWFLCALFLSISYFLFFLHFNYTFFFLLFFFLFLLPLFLCTVINVTFCCCCCVKVLSFGPYQKGIIHTFYLQVHTYIHATLTPLLRNCFYGSIGVFAFFLLIFFGQTNYCSFVKWYYMHCCCCC